MSEVKARGFGVATTCASVDELIERFRDRVTPDSIFVHTVDARVVGTECGFAILLANGKPALAGTCTVLETFPDGNNIYKRKGMRLGIKRLGVESQRVFAAMQAAREQPTIEAPAPAPVAKPIMPRPTQAMRVVALPERAAVVEAVPRRATQRLEAIAKVTIPPRTEPTRMP